MAIKTLNTNIDSFGFVNREKDSSGQTVKFRCGRDFLYYALHFFYPSQFSPSNNNPLQLEKDRKLGMSLPWWLMWTQLQFIYLPKFLADLKLELTINGKKINTFFDLLLSISVPSKSNANLKLAEIQNAVDAGYASAIDISLGLGGLVDHILFVYGYDQDNLYVFDTHKVPNLEYEKFTQDNTYHMRLPKSVVVNRWSNFGRVWIIKKINA